MKRSLKSILCELACYVTAFSPAISGGALTVGMTPMIIDFYNKHNISLTEISNLLDEVRNNDEFIEYANNAEQELTIAWQNKTITDIEYQNGVQNLKSDEAILEYAVSANPEVIEKYNQYKNEDPYSESYIAPLLAISLSASVLDLTLGQIIMCASGEQKKWINKGKEYRNISNSKLTNESKTEMSLILESDKHLRDGSSPKKGRIEAETFDNPSKLVISEDDENQPGNE